MICTPLIVKKYECNIRDLDAAFSGRFKAKAVDGGMKL
jgi:hypothetical protein